MKQGQALLKLSGPRLDQAPPCSPSPLNSEGRREQLVARMKAVFGPSFAVLPRFSFDAAGTEFASALAASTGGARRRSARGEHVVCTMRARPRHRSLAWDRAAARRSTGRSGTPQPERRAAALLERASVGSACRRGGRGAATQQAVARVHTIGPINTTQVMTGLLVGRMGGVRAKHARDHRARLSVRPAGLVRAAERAGSRCRRCRGQDGPPSRCGAC